MTGINRTSMSSTLSDNRKTRGNKLPVYMRTKNIGVVQETMQRRPTNIINRSAWQRSADDISSEKLFLERRDLIGQWYIHWNDIQRKRFFDFILERSSYAELKFILSWFKKPLVTQQDFTTRLPKVVSTHIMSYLDPRSLCRASRVSWHWKWLAEQDAIWRQKCLKYAWFLPYQPTQLENGAWKRHYIMCIRTIDMDLSLKKMKDSSTEKYSEGPVTQKMEYSMKEEKSRRRQRTISPLEIHGNEDTLRPPWMSNSFRPKHLDFADMSFYGKLKQHGKLTKHTRSKTTPEEHSISKDDMEGKKEETILKRSKSQDLTSTWNSGTYSPGNITLSESIRAETLYQTDGKELHESYNIDLRNEQIIQSPRLNNSEIYENCEAMKNIHDLSMAYPNIKNPRVLFISSEIPANEVLVRSLLFGVLPITYNYDGTTLEGLLEHLQSVLQGRRSKSVGFFVHGGSGSINVVRGQCLSLSSIEKPEFQRFWQTLSVSMMTHEEGGHIDIFHPLAGTDTGVELLSQLYIQTGLTFSSPTGTISSIFNVNDDWLPIPEEETPPKIYFDECNLLAWARVGEYVEETVIEVRRLVYHNFDMNLKTLASKVIGEIVFQEFGMQELSEIQDISKTLIKALVMLVRERHSVEKTDITSNFIKCLQKCNKEATRKTKKPKKLSEVNNSLSSSFQESIDSHENGKDKFDEISDDEVSLGDVTSLGERRSVIAHEILSTEKDYCDILQIIQEIYRKPLESSIKANRPIIGAANIKMIFNDSEVLWKLSKELTRDLSDRLQDWDSHQCLGDIFLKFNKKQKAYMNYLNNYPITLATIEKCEKQHPAFRVLLLQLKDQPVTKLTSLQALLLRPTERVNEYVDLLEAFKHQTPNEHKDTRNLTDAIGKLKQLKRSFDEASARIRRERHLKEVQKQIDNCPALVERNRYFIKQEDVIQLRQANESTRTKAEFRIFRNVADLGLFLFNDCLLVTSKNFVSHAFQRTLETVYKYQNTLPLSTMKFNEIPDSKYVQNAFTIITPKRQWFCQTNSRASMINFITLLNNTKRAALK